MISSAIRTNFAGQRFQDTPVDYTQELDSDPESSDSHSNPYVDSPRKYASHKSKVCTNFPPSEDM